MIGWQVEINQRSDEMWVVVVVVVVVLVRGYVLLEPPVSREYAIISVGATRRTVRVVSAGGTGRISLGDRRSLSRTARAERLAVGSLNMVLQVSERRVLPLGIGGATMLEMDGASRRRRRMEQATALRTFFSVVSAVRAGGSWYPGCSGVGMLGCWDSFGTNDNGRRKNC